MSAQSLLESILKQGLQALATTGQQAKGVATQVAHSPDTPKYATGAAVGGALGLLLGNKRSRDFAKKHSGTALKVGGAAAIGALAYTVYRNWQSNQAAAPSPAAPALAQTPPPALPAPVVEAQSLTLLRAMVAAGKADGHLDERERGLLEAEVARLGAETPLRDWLHTELSRPLDPAEIARDVQSPEQAAEVYLATLLVIDDTSFMEAAYRDELARQLRLDPGLKAQLEQQAQAA